MPLIVTDGSLFKFVYRAEKKHFPVFRIKWNRNSVPYHRPDTFKQPDESDFGFVVLHNIHRIVPASGVAGGQVTVNDADVRGTRFHRSLCFHRNDGTAAQGNMPSGRCRTPG